MMSPPQGDPNGAPEVSRRKARSLLAPGQMWLLGQ